MLKITKNVMLLKVQDIVIDISASCHLADEIICAGHSWFVTEINCSKKVNVISVVCKFIWVMMWFCSGTSTYEGCDWFE